MNENFDWTILEKISVYEDVYSDLPEDIESKTFYPLSSEILPNGNLRMRTSGRFIGGEIWDGNEEITPDHPMFKEWKKIIENKKFFLNKQDELRKIERKQRRNLK